MLTENFSWRRWPSPDTRAVDSTCLIPEAAAWVHVCARLRRLSGPWSYDVEWEDDLSARIPTCWRDHSVIARPWPDARLCIQGTGEVRELHLADGLILPPALERSLPTPEDARRASDPYDFPQTAVLWDLEIFGPFAARVRAFSETFPSVILEAVARWRFWEGQFAVAAACAVPGFTTLLAAHPQLAWLVANRMLRESGERGIRMSDWETILRMGPLWLAVHFLRLPRRRATLATLRRLHFECLSGSGNSQFGEPYPGSRTGRDALSLIQRTLGRRESLETVLRLDTPISADCLQLLAQDAVPHLDFLRELQRLEREREDGPAFVGLVIWDYLHLSERIRHGQLLDVDLRTIRSPRRLRRLEREQRAADAHRWSADCPLSEDTVLDFPFPDDPQLKPLRTCADIRAAGERFGNCLAGCVSSERYLRALANGNGALAIFFEGKASAVVYFHRTGADAAWAVSEASAPYNARLSSPLKNALKAWCHRRGVRPLD